ncbi:MAG: hypothetical protein ACW99J_20945, partial [Candidatus Thorarchaeota archaeon]
MQVKVIDVYPNESIVEYEDADKYIQRRVIPQGLYKIVSRGPATISDNIVNMGIEYSNVDLTQILGEMLPPIRVRDLEDKLRRAGLWTQQDYKENAGAVSGVWQRMRGMDVSTIINAAFA